jgi:hypothetical protein
MAVFYDRVDDESENGNEFKGVILNESNQDLIESNSQRYKGLTTQQYEGFQTTAWENVK